MLFDSVEGMEFMLLRLFWSIRIGWRPRLKILCGCYKVPLKFVSEFSFCGEPPLNDGIFYEEFKD